MTPQTTNWWPGIIALGLSLLCGITYLLIQRSKGGKGAPEPLRDGKQDDLDRRAQSLIEQLKELVAEKHHLAPEQFAAEKGRLEREAAAALRARDEYRLSKANPSGTPGAAETAPAPAAAPTGFTGRNPQLVGALWGAGIVVFFGGLGYLLVSEQRPRDDGMEATGRLPPNESGAPQPPAGGMPQEDQALAEAQERLRTNPNDLESSSLVAHEFIRRQRSEEAERLTNQALAIDPFHVESRVHRGVLRAIRGDTEGAEAELLTLADTYPGAQEALLFLGFISMQTGSKTKALNYFERFSVEVPRNMQPPQLEAAIAQLRQEVGPRP
ncbi:tetratricopeptide repeat protein [Stigmatella erecta]|uniref:Cytochrome c-type biogenesis protein CcmH/NrfG n=1 Tax=Stigmatella erecta TaxID=83460 RepID=A0A1I0K8G4_9BACT|nr:tetratricopeptide repeat protein [Stigmatella erecta]SEU20091.1 Cytochrome c-type biogenesis protein CcmH/NrfG [Stigmatella erecta]